MTTDEAITQLRQLVEAGNAIPPAQHNAGRMDTLSYPSRMPWPAKYVYCEKNDDVAVFSPGDPRPYAAFLEAAANARPALAHLLDEVERLRQLEDRLPKTADGVPVVEGDIVFVLRRDEHDDDGNPEDVISDDIVVSVLAEYDGRSLAEDAYSTLAAAEAARKGAGK